MSYILEALKKSDQQRQRGTTPTLPAATVAVATAKQPVYYGLLAAILLLAGIAIGWLHPWQMQPSHQTIPVAAISPTPASHQRAPVPLQDSAAIAEKTALQLKTERKTPDSSPAVLAATGVYAMKPAVPAPLRSGMPGATAAEKPADTAQAIAMTELPVSIQQEIPAITIQFHAYSDIPANRLVGINSRTLQEGESLAPGLKLEQITPEGVILSYKGYRFQRGIRQ
ncbi:MAG: general secretion pathway protein GspB [Gallionella sp.]|jgi:general secretion pathway protein B